MDNPRRGLYKEQYTKNTDNQSHKFEDHFVLETKFLDPIGFTPVRDNTGVRELADIILVNMDFSSLLHIIHYLIVRQKSMII